jgi:hypothetical protein
MKMGLLWLPLLLLSSICWSGNLSILKTVRIDTKLDSVRISLGFEGAMPEKYRVVAFSDSSGAQGLDLGFLGARKDSLQYAGDTIPGWLQFRQETVKGKDVLHGIIILEKMTSFRAEWKGNLFMLTFANTLSKNKSIWKSPWIYVGIGAATIGGAVFWIATTKNTSSSDGKIEDPDIQLPE